MENIMNYIKPELLVLIPVLYFLGTGLKRSDAVLDKHIPLLLGAAWVLASSDMAGAQDILQAIFAAVTQGILCAGCSVYVDQLGKQHRKDD